GTNIGSGLKSAMPFFEHRTAVFVRRFDPVGRSMTTLVQRECCSCSQKFEVESRRSWQKLPPRGCDCRDSQIAWHHWSLGIAAASRNDNAFELSREHRLL